MMRRRPSYDPMAALSNLLFDLKLTSGHGSPDRIDVDEVNQSNPYRGYALHKKSFRGSAAALSKDPIVR